MRQSFKIAAALAVFPLLVASQAIPNFPASTLWGNPTGAIAPGKPITLGTGLAFSGSVLNGPNLASPGAIGGTTPGAGAFTNLSSSGTVSGTGFSNYLASPPAIGGTVPAAVAASGLTVSGTTVPSNGVYQGAVSQLSFSSNNSYAGNFDSGQHPRWGGNAFSPYINNGGCGTGTNGTMGASSNDMAGKVVIGSATTSTCTINFSAPFDIVPRAVILSPANAAADGASDNYVSSITTTTFVISGTLANHSWYYVVY